MARETVEQLQARINALERELANERRATALRLLREALQARQLDVKALDTNQPADQE